MRKHPTFAEVISWQETRDNANKKAAMKQNHHFNKEIFDLGTEWSLAGKLLEDAREEMKNDKSFITGYERGERLKKIAELNSAPKIR